MKNTFGTALTLTLYGESHGPAVGAVLDGLPPGLPVDEASIARRLARRRPSGPDATARREPDPFQLLSGVFRGHTTGTPLCINIPNTDTRSADYLPDRPRPSHADYAAHVKYCGHQDYRGGGHFSGRLTAPIVAAGAILLDALAARGVRIGTHILRCGGVPDRPVAAPPRDLANDLDALDAAPFPALSPDAPAQMTAAILAAKADRDSVGGVTQTASLGLPPGLGEPWFDSLESLLAHALFGLGGVKGVEFGDGFALADLRGSQANDPLCTDGRAVVTTTNHAGGINGGLSNGMPILFQCAVKPTATIPRPQPTIDLRTLQNATIAAAGRHDPAIVRRLPPCIDALTALVIADLLFQRPPSPTRP
ncbi:MAG: chorismate synthase [Kiritimatiellae bacterium]|nr:chorismate synthase [Kiritimatiellia bacterium]